MKLLNTITSELIAEKQKLELKLERLVNDDRVDTDSLVDEVKDTLRQLSLSISDFTIWSSYTDVINNNNNNNEEKK